jgi:hypothetical protein
VIGCAACSAPSGSGAPPGQSATAAAATPTPTPLASFPAASGVTCPDLAALGLQRALLTASDPNRSDVVLCDRSDLAHPRAPAALAGSKNATFLSLDLVGYVATTGGGPSSTPDQFTSHLRTLDLRSGSVTDVTTVQGLSLAAGWSPDASMVAEFHDSGGIHHFFLKRPGSINNELVPQIQVAGRGGSPDDELLVSFSSDGQYVLFVDTFVSRLQVFRTADGVAVYTAPSGGAGGFRTMAAWAHQGDAFYFRNNSGVYRWDPSGGITSYASGLRWFSPAFSGGDQSLAYEVRSADGTPHVEVRNLGSGAVTSTPAWRSQPAFLSSTALLLAIDQPCPPEGMCLSYVPAGKQAVFHLDTQSETALDGGGWMIGAFWPHP